MLFILGATYLALQTSPVQTFLTRQATKILSDKINATVKIEKVKITFFNKIVLKHVLLEDQKRDTLFFATEVLSSIDSLRIKKNQIAFKKLAFKNCQFNLQRDTGKTFNFNFLIDSLKTEKDTSRNWNLSCNQFSFENSKIEYLDSYQKQEQSFYIQEINFNLSGVSYVSDSLKFKLNDLSLNDGRYLNLKHLQTSFLFSGNKMELSGFSFETNRSNFSNAEFELNFGNESTSLSKANIDFSFSNSQISFFELAQLIPSLKGMDQVLTCSGRIYGNLDDLKGKNVLIKTGKNTSAFFDFYANGLEEPESMFLFIDLKNSKTSFSDLNSIKLPHSSKIRNLEFPKAFYEAGEITYRGNFTGFLSDFVAFGSFSGNMGVLTTDVSVIPEKEGTVIYRGAVSTADFDLGELFRIERIGKLTFSGKVDGSYNKKNKSVIGEYAGNIVEIEANDYVYRNIELDGVLENKMFNGKLVAKDPNLDFNFSGKVDLNPGVPNFDFKLDLNKALPGKLNLSANFPGSELAFGLSANFTGDKIDNLEGTIFFENGSYKNKNGELILDSLKLSSFPADTANLLTFVSNFFDIEITGKYNFQTIVKGFKSIINSYLPATFTETANWEGKNNFSYWVNAKNLDELTKVFLPGYKIKTPFLIYGKVDSENSVFELEGSIPGFSSEKILINNIFIGNNPKNGEYRSKFRIGEILLRNGLTLYNLTVQSNIDKNTIDNQITWTNFHNLTYSGTIKTRFEFSKNDSTNYPHIEITGSPSMIYIADTLWQIDPFTASIDSTSIAVNNFRFFNKNQQITADGKISTNKTDRLHLDFQKINLGDLETYLNKEMNLNGEINGSLGVFDFYDQRLIYSDVLVDNFEFKEQYIGNISATNQWDKNRAVLNSKVQILKNNRKSLEVQGTFNPSDNSLNYTASLDHLSLVVLETVLRRNFSNFHGDATGKVRIHGNPGNILLTGALMGSNAGLTIDYTQVSYHFSDSVYFKSDTIHFDNITLSDIYQNKGVFDGYIVHRNFQDMLYNLRITSPKIMAFNTNAGHNEQFFGQVIANGRLNITGRGRQVNLGGSATTLPGTNVNISLDYESDIEQYDFIEFVSSEESEKQEFLFPEKSDDGFTLNITVRATPEARAQLIYNSQIGDVIKAQGEGILLFEMDKDGGISLSGNYVVERGEYLFTLQNVINKRFTIEQGGSLVWSGSPYNAIIDLHAIYRLKASLYDLLVNSYENIYQNQRIPVECKILLSEELSNPLIDFEIDFPTVEDRIIDELQQYFNTDEEMNKQILSLLVLGKFYTPEYMRGTYEAQNPNLIGTTASELFSNQLSNWLSQISNNVDIGLNYRPGNQITNDEIEFALSTQLFNDRVTINGNIGNNVNPNSTNNSQLVGDFDINVKLIPSGKIQLKAYNRSNNNLIYETAPYTQGVGFSFKEEFNTVPELLKKFIAIFRRKKQNN